MAPAWDRRRRIVARQDCEVICGWCSLSASAPEDGSMDKRLFSIVPWTNSLIINSSMMGDSEEIKEWHFHTYWFARDNHPSALEAQRFHDALLEEVKSDPSFVIVFNGVTSDIIPGLKGTPPPMNHRPVGPHLSGSFEAWVPKESLARALSWFTLNRGSLSILIHPLTRYERNDHSTNAMWLGQPWTLDLQLLREDAITNQKQYPELGLGYSKPT